MLLKNNGNLSIFIISTSLHLFQVSLISKELKRNLFIISDELRGIYDLSLLLKGKILYLTFEDKYSSLIISSVFARKSKTKVNLYICNQNHAISSYLVNRYAVDQLVFLDDGLVSYGLQTERVKGARNFFKKTTNYLLSLLNVKILSYGHGNNLKMPPGVKAVFVSIINEYQSLNPSLKIIPLRKFIDYEGSMKYIDEVVSKSGETQHNSYMFLSYQQSLDAVESVEESVNNQKIVMHPRCVSEVRPRIPYEFLIKDALEVQCGVTSIYLISKCLYGITPTVVLCGSSDVIRVRLMESLV